MNFKPTKNPHLKVLQGNYPNEIVQVIADNAAKQKLERVQILDVGGGKGWGKILYSQSWIDYYALDINSDKNRDKNITYVKGDITDLKLTSKLDQTYDVIFTKDTFEHILNPWDATQNILNLLNENGLFIFLAPFKWRYHSSPYDTYRYTHTGAQYMFERLGGMKKKYAGYIKFDQVRTAGFWPNKKDWTFDHTPFTSPIETIYVGQKQKNYKFDITNLDSDFDWTHGK